MKCLEFLKANLTQKMDQIYHQIKSRETKEFYVCERCHIEFNEENALIYNFTCPECGNILSRKDNTSVINEYNKELDKLKKELKLVDEELNKEKEKLEKSRIREAKKEEKIKKEIRKNAANERRKIREKEAKKIKKKSAKVSKKKKPKKKEIKKGNDGFYGISGDNVEWHFDANEWVDYSYEIDELKKQYGLTDEQTKQLDDKITDYWKSGEFEDFDKEYGKSYQEELLDIVNESKSYKEFMDKIGSENLKVGILEDVEEFRNNNFFKAVEKAVKELKFKVK
jgi:predicted RNA-binding Zn-ribbon protein involved in translation (DUF1610 family)